MKKIYPIKKASNANTVARNGIIHTISSIAIAETICYKLHYQSAPLQRYLNLSVEYSQKALISFLKT